MLLLSNTNKQNTLNEVNWEYDIYIYEVHTYIFDHLYFDW